MVLKPSFWRGSDMRIKPYPPRPARENIVPMINVVFLLLIFFLITSTLAPRPDRPIIPPTVDNPTDAHERASDPNYVFLPSDGTLIYLGHQDDAAWASLSENAPSPIIIQADHALPAATLISIIARLEQLGLGPVQMVIDPTADPKS